MWVRSQILRQRLEIGAFRGSKTDVVQNLPWPFAFSNFYVFHSALMLSALVGRKYSIISSLVHGQTDPEMQIVDFAGQRCLETQKTLEWPMIFMKTQNWKSDMDFSKTKRFDTAFLCNSLFLIKSVMENFQSVKMAFSFCLLHCIKVSNVMLTVDC